MDQLSRSWHLSDLVSAMHALEVLRLLQYAYSGANVTADQLATICSAVELGEEFETPEHSC